MKYLQMIFVMTALTIAAASSAKASTSPGQLRPNSKVPAAPGGSSLPAVKADESLTKTIFSAAQNSAVGQVLVVATAEDGGGDGEGKPHSRSIHCPPDKNDHHDFNYQADDQKRGNDQEKDKDKDKVKDTDKDKDKNKDKDRRDDCGKGNDSSLP